jgi:hypothetical protein
MIGQIRLTNWQWVFVGGLAIALITVVIVFAARFLAQITLLWLNYVGIVLFGLAWITAGSMIVTNWRGGLDAAIQQEQELQRRRGKDPDAVNWEMRRKVLRILGFVMIVFSLPMIAFAILSFIRFPS